MRTFVRFCWYKKEAKKSCYSCPVRFALCGWMQSTQLFPSVSQLSMLGLDSLRLFSPHPCKFEKETQFWLAFIFSIVQWFRFECYGHMLVMVLVGGERCWFKCLRRKQRPPSSILTQHLTKNNNIQTKIKRSLFSCLSSLQIKSLSKYIHISFYLLNQPEIAKNYVKVQPGTKLLLNFNLSSVFFKKKIWLRQNAFLYLSIKKLTNRIACFFLCFIAFWT